MAAPFVQGRLREEYLSVTIKTECAHCAQPMEITLDSELKYQIIKGGAEPLVFEPHVNWDTFTGSNIIDAF